MEKSMFEALENAEKARGAYEDACIDVWRGMQREHPHVSRVITELGLSDTEIAVWICTHNRYLGGSPAQLTASGHGQTVTQFITRTLVGIVT